MAFQAMPDAAAPTPAVPLMAEYRRFLETGRSLAPTTVRNYLADLAPFFEYLASQGLVLDTIEGNLRRFVTRHGDGQAAVAAEYRGLIRDYVAWLLGERTLRGGRRRGHRGHQPASVVRSLAALRTFIRFLIERQLLPDAPVWATRATLMRRFSPKAPRHLPDILSSTEAARLMEASSPMQAAGALGIGIDTRNHAILELLYGSGLRVSEVSGLDLRDVALRPRTVRVWGKGSKARMVPLGAKSAAALAEYLSVARPALATKHSGAALFLNKSGGRLTQRSIQSLVRRYGAAASVRNDVHPHTLRHSFATHMLDGGADLRIVQELLGHTTPAATQVYTHVSQAEARRVYLAAHPFARDAEVEATQENGASAPR